MAGWVRVKGERILVWWNYSEPLSSMGWKLVLILVFVEKVLVRRVVGPDFLHTLVWLVIVFEFLQVFDDFHWRASSYSVIDQFIFGRRPWCVVKVRSQFKSPDHRAFLLSESAHHKKATEDLHFQWRKDSKKKFQVKRIEGSISARQKRLVRAW